MPELEPRPARTAAAVLLAVPLLVAAALTVFAWPAARVAPRDLPVGVVAPAAALAPLEARLQDVPGSFDLRRFGDEAAARRAIRDREVYGAVVATAEAPRVLVASAASAAVAQALREAVSPLQGSVEDVVPAPASDRRGAAIAASILPLTLLSLLAGVLVLALGRTPRHRLAALAGAAGAAGLAAVAVVQGWLGVLDGSWVANAAVVALGVAAIAATVAGAFALGGRPGLALAAVSMMFLGNPWAGVAVAPELLPAPAGAIGQLLPPGALASLLRSSAFFDGAGGAAPGVVLGCWAASGVLAVAAAGHARRRVRPAAATAG